jgi:outer membrane protein assembly factor BamB
VKGDDVRSLVVNNGLPQNEAPTDPDHTTARLERPHDPNVVRSMGWTYNVDEVAVGAIDGGGQTVIALPSGHLVVLSPDGDPKTTHDVIVLEADIDKGATDLSVVPPFALVLYGGGDAGGLVQRRSGAATKTQLDARKPDGSLAWRASLPVLATQPALDGNGQIYVVGSGIAALDMTGRTLWSVASTVPLRAAAFADGALAVVRGSEVQIVGPDGVIRQSFRAGEELTTYPAIGADGTVWAASTKSLYALH